MTETMKQLESMEKQNDTDITSLNKLSTTTISFKNQIGSWRYVVCTILLTRAHVTHFICFYPIRSDVKVLENTQILTLIVYLQRK